MQIVIDIPEELISEIDDENYQGIISWYDTALYCAIKDGTPLPKGHGRLIDANALEKLCYEHEIGNSAFDGEPLIAQGQYDDGDNIWKSLFDFAPTIIEADKAESEE